MPGGRYLHLDSAGRPEAEERFSCAPGPAGWRYVSQVLAPDGSQLESVDLTVDSQWRALRVEVRAAGWLLRGGVAGADTVWSLAPDESSAAVPEAARAAGFTGRSPAFAVVTARMLGLTQGRPARVRLLLLTGTGGQPLPVDEGWALTGVTTHATDAAPLPVERYEVADLASGQRRVIHLAGDVVLDAPSLELAELDGPPTLPMPAD
jgi:hypothetical protein